MQIRLSWIFQLTSQMLHLCFKLQEPANPCQRQSFGGETNDFLHPLDLILTVTPLPTP